VKSSLCFEVVEKHHNGATQQYQSRAVEWGLEKHVCEILERVQDIGFGSLCSNWK
jgi:hypothetical protein